MDRVHVLFIGFEEGQVRPQVPGKPAVYDKLLSFMQYCSANLSREPHHPYESLQEPVPAQQGDRSPSVPKPGHSIPASPFNEDDRAEDVFPWHKTIGHTRIVPFYQKGVITTVYNPVDDQFSDVGMDKCHYVTGTGAAIGHRGYGDDIVVTYERVHGKARGLEPEQLSLF